MKRLIFVFIVLLFLSSFTFAQIEDVPRDSEEAKDEAKEYLLQKWRKILETNVFFNKTFELYDSSYLSVKTFYDNNSEYIDPVFVYTLGIKPGLNLRFFLTLIIWILLVIYIFRIFDLFSTFSKGASFMFSLLMVVIVSNLGIVQFPVRVILDVISLFSNPVIQSVLWIFIGTVFFLAVFFARRLVKLAKKIKDKRKKLKEKVEKEAEKIDRDNLRKFTDSLFKFEKGI